MKSTQYSEKVLDHFRNPRNVGTLEGNDVAKGTVGNPVCGDLMEFYIRVKDNTIVDIKFKTFGCGSAIATASMITELAKGKTIDEALKITRKDVADELDGLPPIKMHCSNLAADALRAAITNYKVDTGKKSVELALSLAQQTPRVVFVTRARELSVTPELKKKIKQSDIKVLRESVLLEIKGLNQVEQVRIHDQNEDEEYDLFLDAVILLPPQY
ncbi:nitrogen fixation protein NifU [candidate division WOR_3 bacterium SM23_60]|uniref:Nitrogen fixation protein NifU n=1 Tax=candidate division WOR_3 bacterium SM23_60 TaxID=1703780 RepID=A0A0S8GHA6_UNCW3|nr:MAG: nitrogen fixation protein NifU [candidate division WOR_3 bacterium SM23_60]